MLMKKRAFRGPLLLLPIEDARELAEIVSLIEKL
jgi:hypothetical protein